MVESAYKHCTLCPRSCGIDRSEGLTGFCGQTSEIRMAFAGIDFGEEPPISGNQGSGTVFFSGCTLKCRSCQNYQISRENLGRTVSAEALAEVFLTLEREGAMNLNLVTATPFTPGVIKALVRAREAGLSIPLVWNTSGYETAATLDRLDAHVNIYLTDLKTLDPALSERMFGTPDYPETTREAVQKMISARGYELGKLSGDSLHRGVIVRHLILPGELESTRGVLEWFRENLYGRAVLSLMFQYTPVRADDDRLRDADMPDRRVSRREYGQVFEWLEELQIEEGFIQEFETGSSWLPDFSKSNPFSDGLSKPLWHFEHGPS